MSIAFQIWLLRLEWQTKLKFPKSETETESKFAKFNIGIDIDGEGKVTHVYHRVYDVAERIRNHDLEELKKKIDNKNESIEDLQNRIVTIFSYAIPNVNYMWVTYGMWKCINFPFLLS